jgi:LPPG:FO 2-phospho-L-lactate transferase
MRIVVLSGGVGGARMARGFAGLADAELTVLVNVGDDADNHGLRISPDLDTVVYTLAGVEGPQGWGRASDTFSLNEELARFGVDNTFQLGDRDLALKLFRTHAMANGSKLSEVTALVADSFGIGAEILPVTDDRLRTMIEIADGWVTFQDYFVARRFEDEVLAVSYEGADTARPVAGALAAIGEADLVVIAPSNPPLSVWPMTAIHEIREALAHHPMVTAVSPLIGGATVKGPADRVMASLGLPKGNVGVAEAYAGLIDRLVIDVTDGDDASSIDDIEVMATDILIKEPDAAVRLARELIDW